MAVAEFEVSIDIDTKAIISSITQVNNAFKTALSNINNAIDQVNAGWKAFIKSTEKPIKPPDFKTPDMSKTTKEFDKSSKEISKDIDDINKDWDGFKKEVEKPIKPKMDPEPIKKDFASISAASSIAGQNMTQMLTMPILNFGKSVLDTGQEYSKAMGMVKGVTDGSSETMDKLNKKAMEMGSDSLFSSTEAAQGMYYLASAGYSVDDVMDSLEGTMRLATAGQLDLDKSSEIVTGAMTAMGVSAKDTNRFVDVLAKTAAATNTDIPQLGYAFKYVAALAGTLGYSIDDVSLALGTMANNGIKGEQAGTSFRGAISKMLKPTDDGAALMDKLGLKMADAEGNALPLKTLLDNLRTSFSGLTEEQKAEYAITLFGQEAMAGMLSIINSSPEQYDALTQSIQNADGTAKNMSDTMEDTSPVDKMNAAIETMMTSISKNLAPTITGIADAIGNLASWFGNLDPAVQGGILAFLGLLALIGPILSFIGVLGLIAGAVGTTMGAVAIVVGWVVLAIIAVIAIGVLLVMYWKNIVQFFKDVGAWFVNLWKGIVTFFAGVAKWFFELPGKIISFFSKLPYYIGYVIGLIIGYIALFGIALWKFVTETIPQWIASVIKWFSELPGKIWTWLLETVNKIGKWISEMQTKAATEIPKFIASVIKWFQDLPKNMLEIGQNIVKGIWDGIVNMTNWIIGKVKEFAKGIMDGIKAAMGIASPSKITTKFGEYLAEGLGVGFGDEIANVYRQMEKSIAFGNNKLDATVQMGMEQTSSELGNSSQNLGMSATNGYQTNSKYNAPNNVTINVRSPAEAVKELRVLNKQMALGW